MAAVGQRREQVDPRRRGVGGGQLERSLEVIGGLDERELAGRLVPGPGDDVDGVADVARRRRRGVVEREVADDRLEIRAVVALDGGGDAEVDVGGPGGAEVGEERLGDDLVDEAVPPDAPLLQQAGRDGLLHVAEHPRPVVEQRDEQLERELAPGRPRRSTSTTSVPRRLSRRWTTSVTLAGRLGRRPVDREPPVSRTWQMSSLTKKGLPAACRWMRSASRRRSSRPRPRRP